MRAALGWALQPGETEVVLRLGDALWWFWSVRGHYSEGRRWLEEALAAGGRGSIESRAMVLAGVGALALEQGDLDRAEEASAEGLELLLHEAPEPSEAKYISSIPWDMWHWRGKITAGQLRCSKKALR